MARINNLTNFLTDIATAIKSKTGRNTNITPSNFDTEILSIASDLGSKNISISSNGTSTYQASNDNLDGYSSVAITTNVQPNLQSKTVSPTTSEQTVSADNNYDGLSQVTVSAIQTETKTVNPSTSNVTVTPSSNKYLSGVTVNAVDNTIDNNIVASNIKKDVSILGVTGTYDNSSSLGTKTITENGTYNASSDSVDGYSQVTVNVPNSGSSFTITNGRYLFAYGSRIECYDELLALFQNVTNVSDMFYNATVPSSIDLSKLNKFNITDMSYMFSYSDLKDADLTKLDTSSVTTMYSMFSSIKGVTSLDLSNFDTSNVTDMRSLFQFSSVLTQLDLSNFNTSKVTSMSSMFWSLYYLQELDISNFDFSGVTSYGSIFKNCGTSNPTPTTVYVKDSTTQQWILNLSSSDRPSDWSTSNVVIKGS